MFKKENKYLHLYIFFRIRSGLGSFNNPYKNAKDKKENHSGTKGRRIMVRANHFPMNVRCQSVYRYDVKFKMPWSRPVGKKDRPLLLRAVEVLKKVRAKKEFPPTGNGVVFDGRSTLLSVHQLKIQGPRFVGNVTLTEDIDQPDSRKVNTYLNYVISRM